MHLRSVVIIIVYAFCMPLMGQIVVDWSEIPHAINTEWTENDQDSVTVNLGSAGGPQNWYFTSQPMGDDSSSVVIVPVASTPFADSFPSANLVYKSPADSDTCYQYYELNNNFLATLGQAGCTPDSNWLLKYNQVDSAPLPLTYGTDRSFHLGYIILLNPPYSMSYDHYGRQVVDAYGSVTIPYGTFECLRVCDFDTCVMIMYNNSVPFYWDTTTHIKHAFVAENRAAVVCVTSYPDETNPNYSAALCLQRLTDFSTDIQEEKNKQVNSTSLSHTMFSGAVTFSYTLAKSGHVVVRIFDAKGSLISTVVNAYQNAGKHILTWVGANKSGGKIPDGVYFFHLCTRDLDIVDKVVLVR